MRVLSDERAWEEYLSWQTRDQKSLKRINRHKFLSLLILGLIIFSSVSCKGQADEVQTITISAAGDCTLGRNYKMAYENSWDDCFSRFGPEYFLQNVSSVFENDDITIANLEGVLSGHPAMGAAADIEREPCEAAPYEQRPERVPSIIYTLLGE